MKRTLLLAMASGMAVTWFGCQAGTETEVSRTPTAPETADPEPGTPEVTLVSLSVPNMV